MNKEMKQQIVGIGPQAFKVELKEKEEKNRARLSRIEIVQNLIREIQPEEIKDIPQTKPSPVDDEA